MTQARLTGLLVALAVGVTGCGVPQDRAPRALNPGAPAFAAPSGTPMAEPDGPGRVALYFIRDGKVVLTTRAVRRSTPVPALLTLLLAGPTPTERKAGLGTALPTSVSVEDVTVEAGTAIVSLGGPAEQVSNAGTLAFAQIVATLTPGRVDGVRFRRDNQDLDVPRGDGLLSSRPLDRNDYAGLLVSTGPRAG